MDKGTVQVIYGTGKGKTGAALGRAIQMLNQGKTVIVIQFMKGSTENGGIGKMILCSLHRAVRYARSAGVSRRSAAGAAR